MRNFTKLKISNLRRKIYVLSYQFPINPRKFRFFFLSYINVHISLCEKKIRMLLWDNNVNTTYTSLESYRYLLNLISRHIISIFLLIKYQCKMVRNCHVNRQCTLKMEKYYKEGKRDQIRKALSEKKTPKPPKQNEINSFFCLIL